MNAEGQKVLLVTRNLPPLVGGMERLMRNAAQGIAAYAELTVIGPRGCAAYLPAGVRAIELEPGPAWFLPLALLRSLAYCWTQRPAVVLGGSGLLGPVLMLLRWLCGVRVVVYLHGLDIVVDNRLYQALFVPSFRRLHHVVVNSENTGRLALEAGVRASRVTVIHPGTDLPEPDRAISAERMRGGFGVTARHVLLFVGRVTPRKGLLRFVERCLPEVLSAEPDTCLVVVGDHPGQGLAAAPGELQDVIAASQRLGLESAVKFLGQLDDRSLLDAYAAASVLVFPLVETPGDVEGFGMVAIEAAACGTPTVAFAVGGVVDAVAPGDSGQLVPPGDYPAFRDALLAQLREEPAPEACTRFAARFAWPRFHREMKTVLLAAAPDNGGEN